MAVEGISRNITFQNEDIISVAQSNSGKKLTRSEVSRYWYKKGISFIWNEPLKYVILEWKKFRNIFSGAERSNMYSMTFEKNNLTPSLKIPFVSFYLLFPFLCAGIVTAFKQWKKFYMPFLFLIVNSLNILIFFYDTRFFVITMSVFIVISSTGFWNILSLYRVHRLSSALFRQSSSIALISGFALLILILYRDSKFPSQDWRFFMALGEIYYDMGSYDKSIDNYIRSFEHNKSDFRSSIGACKALLKQGNIIMAADLYKLTLKALGEKNKHMISDDPDFDQLRDYIVSKQNQAAAQ
jgi:tetratricopeptide (TPR) repeat protein